MPTPSMNAYDRNVGSYLQQSRYYSEWIRQNSETISRLVREMPMRPVWLTMAQDEMANAEAELRAALRNISDSQRRFADLPIQIDPHMRASA